ncbi:hypothetical protein [Lactococcus lactis]|uniref:hypothetical protein n=1 Tax=Lactococcus lactis TaxID=1358 RepID=UPI00071D3AC3|nr:hypothetical protein [Lactococcus lactis]
MESFGSIIPKVIENRKLKFFTFHKIRIKKTGNVPKLINDLMNGFRLGPVQRSLSKPLCEFYSNLYQRNITTNGLTRGIALSTALLPIWNS